MFNIWILQHRNKETSVHLRLKKITLKPNIAVFMQEIFSDKPKELIKK